MSTDFIINFDFKNDWVIAIWKFQLWINLAYIWWKLLESDPKSEFSNGYNPVIFKVKIYDKISKHSELPREFKNAKIFQKKIWEDFLKNIWKSAIFNNWKKIFLKIADFQIFFKKSFQIFFKNIFAFLNSRSVYLYVGVDPMSLSRSTT